MLRSPDSNLGHQTSQDTGDATRISVGDLSCFLLSTWVSSLLHNQPHTPRSWSHSQGGASDTTLDTLPSLLTCDWRSGWSPARSWLWFLLQLLCFSESSLSYLLLWWRREKPGEDKASVGVGGRRHPFSVATEGWIQCCLGLWRGRAWSKAVNEKILGSKGFSFKKLSSQRDFNQENSIMISGRTLCFKGKWAWRETMRKTEKEEKMNNTRFLMSNCFV